MSRCVDEVEFVRLAVFGVVHAHGVELDRDAALALEVHRVEDLCPHTSLIERTSEFDQPIGNGGFAVVDMGNDTEIADLVSAHGREYTTPHLHSTRFPATQYSPGRQESPSRPRSIGLGGDWAT